MAKQTYIPNGLLREARDLKELTQEELADKIGVSVLTLGRWERGEAFPNAYYRRKLREFFNKQSDEELGLLRKLYRASAAEEIGIGKDQPAPAQQGGSITPKQHVRKVPLSAIIFSFFLICLLVIGGLIFVVRHPTSANQAPAIKATPSPVLGSLLDHYQLPKIGSYDTTVNALAWSPNSSYLACASGDKLTRIFELGTTSPVIIFHGHSDNVNSIAWFPDGTQVASASSDKTVQIWDAFTGRVLTTFSASASVWAVAVSPDGKEIAWAGEDGIIEVWQITPKMRLFTYTEQAGSGGIWGLAFSHDGRFIAAGDNTGDIQIIDAKSGKMTLNYTEQTQTIYGLNWSPNDRYIASASGDSQGSNGSVRVWNTSTGKTAYVYVDHLVSMQLASWSSDGTRIASAGADGTVQVWDAFNGKHPFIYTSHSGIVFTVAWSPDGNKIASGDAAGNIQIWWAK